MSKPLRVGHRRAGLFRRIYGTFVATFLIAAIVVGTGVWLAARSAGDEWVTDALDTLDARHDAIVEVVGDREALGEIVAQIDRELDTRTAIYAAAGDKLAGEGPPHMPMRAHKRERQLKHGRPAILRQPSDRPIVLFPLVADNGDVVALAHVVRLPPTRMRIVLLVAPLLIAAFGLGAWRLSRSLTSRIATLEAGVGRIAHGELAHRIAVPASPSDEIDDLGTAVNDMASRLDRLVAGQRTLLANVSHELRTPISRVKVLLEILGERLERMAEDPAATGYDRVRTGISEMAEDIAEMETLIADLLTSGRLELRAGEGRPMDCEPVDVAAVVSRSAARFRARVDVAPGLTVSGDAFLLERLFSNLLANARRACPDGAVEVVAQRIGDTIEIRVEDEGNGIPAEHREVVFEPFRRLDDARSRDRGGVGLGLYLCRQICTAHDGTLVAQARPDGKRGASLCARLPATA
jgi:signal transduction histidine kinase